MPWTETLLKRDVTPLVDLRRPIDIEDLLIWTYRDQRAHLVMGRGMEAAEARLDDIEPWHCASGDGVAQVIRLQRLGCRVDGGGPSCDHLHEDAETVHRAVLRCAWPGLMIRHGMLADRPDWMPGALPHYQAVRDGRGRPKIQHEVWDKARHYGWCVINWKLSQARIDAARSEYELWLGELRWLADALGGARLVSWRVLPSVAPARPWERSADPVERRIGADGHALVLLRGA